MYFSTLLAAVSLLYYALPSSAQDLSGLPSCAQGPTLQSIGNSGCQLTDIACICKNQNFINSLTPVVEKACSASDLAKVEQFTSKLCGSVGVSVAYSATSAATSAASAASATGSAASSMASAMTASSTNRGADVATSSFAAASASSTSAADGGQVALLREGAISWCVSAIFLGVGGAWVLRGL